MDLLSKFKHKRNYNAPMHYALSPFKEFGNYEFAKMMTLAAIFSSKNYIRQQYLDVFSFAVSLSIYIWVQVENSLLQKLKMPKNQLQFNQAAER